FSFNDTLITYLNTLSLHDALPISETCLCPGLYIKNIVTISDETARYKFLFFNEYNYIVLNCKSFYRIFVPSLACSSLKLKWSHHCFDVLQSLHDHNFQRYSVK